ncbi:FtsX-like permease family protein [uncultured Proteiniphilum sp.]|uniref:ABC transporter permease n=1 Tax=uncultured Proteiniphilum sp. TaxID=497637 RepID=UPI0026216A90|nr:FtsX-like permease family protein [uncultured Proteiniphilum sp.]
MPVVGVIEDMYIDSPVVPVFPSVYVMSDRQPWEAQGESTKFYAYKYTKESRYATEKEIKRIATEDVGNRSSTILNMEELYAEYTKSERYLLILLSIMTAVAILIAVFGVYSIVTLACNRRRKEIAIRKVNGAKAWEIFLLFFRQYFMVTMLSCIVAFPIGMYIMQRWLEQYTRRISMEWWIFAGIFLLVVLASIFSRVRRAARENPAEVVKSE